MSISNYSSIKNRFSLIIISIQLLLNFVLSQNIILNPGFESGTTTNWTEIGTASSITQSSTYQYSGSYSCKFTNPTSSYSARGVQSDFINVTAGEYYDLSGWFYVDNEGSGVISDTDFRLRIFWFQSDQTTACDPSSNPSSTGWSIDSFDTWSKKELTDLQAPSNAAYAYVLVECKESSNNNNDAYIDDISLIPSVSISGTSGFRMMSSPVAGTIFSDLLAELWIQGMTGGDVTSGDANVWTFDVSSQSWSALSNLSTASQTAGHGFLVYVFSDVDNDGTDDLPVTLSLSGSENSSSASVESISDGDWALAGNPYASTIDWDLVTQSNVATSAYVYDNAKSGGAGYISWNGSAGSLTNGLIAPYQGFFVQGSGGSGSITIETADKSSTAGTFYKTMNDSTGSMIFSITSGDYSDETYVSFMTNGEEGIDNSDAYKLLPMTPTERIVGVSYAESNGLDINNLPYSSAEDLSVSFDALSLTLNSDHHFETDINEIVLNWNIENLPEHISISLTNNNTGEMVYLEQQDSYTFNTVAKGSFPSYGSGPVSSYPLIGDALFTLTVHYSPLNNENDIIPSHFKLYQPYPNPFNPATQISFEIPTDGLVECVVYDINGQLVDTLIEDILTSGHHEIHWKPKNISSGIYFIQLSQKNSTITQKITFLK